LYRCDVLKQGLRLTGNHVAHGEAPQNRPDGVFLLGAAKQIL